MLAGHRFASIPNTIKRGRLWVVAMSTDVNQSISSFSDRLRFDNRQLARLPVDTVTENYVRKVRNALFSRVRPTPLAEVRLVAYSVDALRIIDMTEEDTKRADFAEYFAGNRLWPGSDPSSHCYCGFQFGLFAGQLGDGAAISLGEIINRNEERWDLQLKGSGPTPYSRMADGRKVLRSSIREFLCSEAMHYLRVPTTRAATCVVSSDRVVRDALYDGNIRAESCAVVSRLAPSFIRFGSFENFRPIDRTSYNLGGCVGQIDLLHRLFDHTIETLYPEILARHSQLTDPAERRSAQCVDFFGTIVQRTARLVARWQTIGFCHGVLNTDNMSILGLTLDYGPYGFVERFDPNMISNHSDSSGYYSFDRQVAACRWNLCRLAEMLSLMVDSIDSLRSQLTDHYSKVYADEFLSEWRLKLGLGSELQRGHDQIWSDRKLIGELLNVLYQTGSDYTNCVRKLSLMTHEEIRGDRDDFDFIVQELLTERIPLKAFVQQLTNEVDSIDYQVSNHSIDSIVPDNLIDASNEKTHFCDKDMLLRDIQTLDERRRTKRDTAIWTKWLRSYVDRLRFDWCDQLNQDSTLIDRAQRMNQVNPDFVLRNHVLQSAIEAAEHGDFSLVQKLVDIIQNPFDVTPEIRRKYSHFFKLKADKICVSCSS